MRGIRRLGQVCPAGPPQRGSGGPAEPARRCKSVTQGVQSVPNRQARYAIMQSGTCTILGSTAWSWARWQQVWYRCSVVASCLGEATTPSNCFLPWCRSAFSRDSTAWCRPRLPFTERRGKLPATGVRRSYVRPAGLRHAPDDQGNSPKKGHHLDTLKQMFGDVHLNNPSATILLF